MAIHLANLSRELDDEIGTKTNSGYAELRLGIDLGYAKSISICGLGIVVLLRVAECWVTAKSKFKQNI